MKINEATLNIFSIVILLLILELVPRLFIDNNFIIPLSDILISAPNLYSEGLIPSLSRTIIRTILGFAIACILGIFFGVLIGKINVLNGLLRPIIDFLRPLPSSALIPLVIIIIGLSETSYYLIIVFGTVWPVLFGTIDGVKYVDEVAVYTLKQLKLSKFKKLWIFTLPEAAPEIITGMKVSLSIALILTITAELLIGGRPGLGKLLIDMQGGYNYAEMYLIIFIIAFLGLTLNKFYSVIESKIQWISHLQGQRELISDSVEINR